MVKISLPYKPKVPPTMPGMRVSVAPSPHVRFTDDIGYYDAMGRDPLQMFQVWGIKDPVERVAKLEEILPEWPGPRHQRHMLSDAARRGDESIVRFLVETGLKAHPDIPGRNGVPPREEDSDEETDDGEGEMDDITVAPLHTAALHGHLECVKIIFEMGKLDVDICDEVGRTPLCVAAQGGHAEVIEYLLNQGANPTLRLDADSKISQEYLGDLAGADTLEFAASNSTPEIMELLLQHPIYGSKRSRKYSTSAGPGVYVTPLAIYRAAIGKNMDTLRYLLHCGSYPLADEDGKPKGALLDEAQKQGIIRVLPEIIAAGSYEAIQIMLAYLYPTNENGEVMPFDVPNDMRRHFTWAAYHAVETNDCKKFEWVYGFGIKEHDTMSLDELPKDQIINIQHLLDSATEAGSMDCVKMLIDKYGAKPDDMRLPPATTPIYAAAVWGQPEVLRYYLENHTIELHSGNGTFITGPTALYGAIAMKSLDCVDLLLKHGGPVDQIDEEIRGIDKKIQAVLITEFGSRTPVRLQTERNAAERIKNAKEDWQNFNPCYVRLELDSADKQWISKLVPRKSNAALQQNDRTGRRLDKEDQSHEDPAPYLIDYPCSKEGAEKLAGDDDIMPAWKPLFVPA